MCVCISLKILMISISISGGILFQLPVAKLASGYIQVLVPKVIPIGPVFPNHISITQVYKEILASHTQVPDCTFSRGSGNSYLNIQILVFNKILAIHHPISKIYSLKRYWLFISQ